MSRWAHDLRRARPRRGRALWVKPLAWALLLFTTCALGADQVQDALPPVTSHAEGHARSSMPTGIRRHAGTRFDSARAAGALSASLAMLPLIPGFYLFYSRDSKFDVGRALQAFGAMAALSLFWLLCGYTLSFGPNLGSSVEKGVFESARPEEAGWPIIGECGFGFEHVETQVAADAIEFPIRSRTDELPELHLVMWQMLVFVAASAPLFTVVQCRAGFPKALAFSLLWGFLVYVPLAHWSVGFGWLQRICALDFAGATMLHVGAGASALGLSRILPPRAASWGSSQAAGTVLIWIGSLALNAAFGLWRYPAERAEIALFGAHLSAMAGVVGSLGCTWLGRRPLTPQTFASGCLAGLAAISAGSGLVAAESAVVIGFAAGIACSQADHCIRRRGAPDDPLREVALLQGLGGAIGLLGTGVFTTPNVAGWDSLGNPLSGAVAGNPAQLVAQSAAVAAAAIWAVPISNALARVLRIRPEPAPPRAGTGALSLDAQGEHP